MCKKKGGGRQNIHFLRVALLDPDFCTFSAPRAFFENSPICRCLLVGSATVVNLTSALLFWQGFHYLRDDDSAECDDDDD